MSEVSNEDFVGAGNLDAETEAALVAKLRLINSRPGRGWQANQGVAWALVYGDRGDFALLCGPERPIVEDSLDLKPPFRRYRDDGNRSPQVVPEEGAGRDDRKSEVLILTYLGGEYVGFCTYVGGKPRWF